MTLKKYEYYCETEEKLKYEWSETIPEHCYENVEHIININSIVIVDKTENNFSPDDYSLNAQKERKIIEIDKRTVELINEGFEFDSIQFSLSEKAQINWLGIKTLEAIINFPIKITTINNEEYLLGEANLNTFIAIGLNAKQTHLDSGRALKIQINNTLTEAELNLINDER